MQQSFQKCNLFERSMQYSGYTFILNMSTRFLGQLRFILLLGLFIGFDQATRIAAKRSSRTIAADFLHM
jgi:hypothetical protein